MESGPLSAASLVTLSSQEKPIWCLWIFHLSFSFPFPCETQHTDKIPSATVTKARFSRSLSCVSYEELEIHSLFPGLWSSRLRGPREAMRWNSGVWKHGTACVSHGTPWKVPLLQTRRTTEGLQFHTPVMWFRCVRQWHGHKIHLSPHRQEERVYSGAKYELLWPGNTDPV